MSCLAHNENTRNELVDELAGRGGFGDAHTANEREFCEVLHFAFG